MTFVQLKSREGASKQYSWMHLDFSCSLILGTENTVDVDESLFDDLDLDGEEFEDDSEEDN